MYTMIEQEYTRYENGVPMYRVTIQVDTENDLPTPESNWEVGSYALIANKHKYMVLNGEREWV